MLNFKFTHGHHTLISPLLVLIFNIRLVQAQLPTPTNTTNCKPLNCKASCTPSCSNDQVCILRTMTDCAVCPASNCMSRTVLGLPPIETSNTTNRMNDSSSDTTGALIGGIVGGLVGFGLLVGIGVYCYIKKSRNRGKLPFAFTASGNASRHIIESHENFQQSPPPTPHTTLSYQRDTRPIGLTQLASTTTIYTTHNNNISNTTTQPNVSPTIESPIHGTIPEEFEERIALQNKRISEIMYNNPRLSQLQQQSQRLEQDRNSGISFTTTDDDSEYDYDDEKRSISSRHQSQIATAVQVVQVTRAKAQIMRVDSVRSSIGLNRSGSVRTLTAVTPSIPTPITRIPTAKEEEEEDDDDDDDMLSAHQFPSIPNNRSFIDDPFLDTHSK